MVELTDDELRPLSALEMFDAAAPAPDEAEPAPAALIGSDVAAVRAAGRLWRVKTKPPAEPMQALVEGESVDEATAKFLAAYPNLATAEIRVTKLMP